MLRFGFAMVSHSAVSTVSSTMSGDYPNIHNGDTGTDCPLSPPMMERLCLVCINTTTLPRLGLYTMVIWNTIRSTIYYPEASD